MQDRALWDRIAVYPMGIGGWQGAGLLGVCDSVTDQWRIYF